MFIIVAMIKKVISSQATIPPTTVEREHDALHEFQNNSLYVLFFKKETNWRRTISPQSTTKRKKDTLRMACWRHVILCNVTLVF
jgi:hypothetical protein